VAGLLDRLGHLALVLQRGAGEAAREDLALLIAQLQEEVCILVINILDTGLLEPAILGLFGFNLDRIEVPDF